MTETATIDWFGRWGTSVFSENTAMFVNTFILTRFYVLTVPIQSINGVCNYIKLKVLGFDSFKQSFCLFHFVIFI